MYISSQSWSAASHPSPSVNVSLATEWMRIQPKSLRSSLLTCPNERGLSPGTFATEFAFTSPATPFATLPQEGALPQILRHLTSYFREYSVHRHKFFFPVFNLSFIFPLDHVLSSFLLMSFSLILIIKTFGLFWLKSTVTIHRSMSINESFDYPTLQDLPNRPFHFPCGDPYNPLLWLAASSVIPRNRPVLENR